MSSDRPAAALTRDTPPAAKAALRAAALERRAGLSAADHAAFAARLAEVGLARARQTPGVTAISLYSPLPGEPDVRPLLFALAQAGYATLLPVTGRLGTPLTFRRWRPGEPLARGRMNIAEPPAAATAMDPDLMFVPLAAFDRRGHRIGYGAGYYDASIAAVSARRPLRTIGIAFSVSEVAEVPHQDHDQRLDAVLTEREWIDCRGE